VAKKSITKSSKSSARTASKSAPARDAKAGSKSAKATTAKVAKTTRTTTSAPKAAKSGQTVKIVKTVSKTKPAPAKPVKPASAPAPASAAAPAPAPKPEKVAKPPTMTKAQQAAAQAMEIRKIKSPLSKKELAEYRALLIAKRAEILGDMSSMSREALADSTNLSHMPIHMADVGSDQYDQELMLGLVESERRLVNEINDALQRIADGIYGVCQSTGKPIGKPRLQAKPWAKYCIEAAREMERTGRRF
jgi:RNA polymerase-binding protein DksA